MIIDMHRHFWSHSERYADPAVSLDREETARAALELVKEYLQQKS